MARTAAVLFALLGVAAWVASPRPIGPGPFAAALAAGAVLIVLGLVMARRLGHRPPVRPGRLAAALVLGALVGAVVLAVLVYALVPLEPALAARLRPRAQGPAWMPLALAVEASVLEELVFRLFLFTLVVWLAARAWRRGPVAVTPLQVGVANLVSTLAFAGVHVPAWLAATQVSAALIAAVLLLNGVAGGFLGLVYWRWGIEAAIAAHFAADLVVQGVGPRLLA